MDRIVALDDHGYADKAVLYTNIVSTWKLDPALLDLLVGHFWSSFDNYSELPDDTLRGARPMREP